MPDLLLAADIGATNTRCRLVDSTDLARGLDEHTYGNGAPVNEAIAAFLARIGERRHGIRAAAFGVAGRVMEGDVRMTNRPREKLTDEHLSAALGLAKSRVVVVNDMVAHLAGVEHSETIMLRRGRPAGEVEGIIMPGSGLGVGYSVRGAGGGRIGMPSEGGHLYFGPPTPDHDMLLTWARGHAESSPGGISWEWLVSGPGLARIYMALEAAAGAGEPRADVMPEQVTAAATEQESPLDRQRAQQAIALLLELTGARAGNLCLDVLATRAMYFGGNLLNLLYDGGGDDFRARLIEGFDTCGPDVLREMMCDVPLVLVRSSDSGLRGAAALAQSRI